MKKLDYFLASINAGAHEYKGWVIDAFSLVEQMSIHRAIDHPWPLAKGNDGEYLVRDMEGNWLPLEGTNYGDPAFSFKEVIDLKKGDMLNVVSNVTTCYGTALYNAIVFIYPFGAKIPYWNGRLNPKKIEEKIKAMLTADEIKVDEYLKFGQAVFTTVGFAQLCVYSATPKTMTADPRMAEIRNKLIQDNKDHLTDPVVIAKIDAALVAVDREYMKGDPGEGFYIKSKSYDVVRKRMYGMLGGEDAFGDGTSVTLLEKSLNDGWDINRLPEMASSLREGSFNRGAQTELGGAIVKEINRYSTNSSISEEDCHVKIGLFTDITDSNKDKYLNNYVFVSGKEILTTAENIQEFVGKTIEVRSPHYCLTSGVDYCVHCSGTKLAETPHAIGSYMSDIGSGFMSTFLALMHGRKLETASWSMPQRIN